MDGWGKINYIYCWNTQSILKNVSPITPSLVVSFKRLQCVDNLYTRM